MIFGIILHYRERLLVLETTWGWPYPDRMLLSVHFSCPVFNRWTLSLKRLNGQKRAMKTVRDGEWSRTLESSSQNAGTFWNLKWKTLNSSYMPIWKRANISLVATIGKLSTPIGLIINHVTLTKQNEHNFITPILLDTSFILHYHYLSLSLFFNTIPKQEQNW